MEEQIKPKTIDRVKNAVDINIRLPVLARLKKRVKEIQFKSQAKTVKIPLGNTHMFETESPQMFICGLQASLNNGVGLISYQTYKMKGKNKEVRFTYSEVVNSKGDTVKVPINASYILDKIITERIEYLKPIKTEVMENAESK